jgi:uncharacterized protein (DUF2252 family)
MTDADPSNGDRHAAADALWAFRRDALPTTRDEREQAGRSLRKAVPRSSHADWAPWSGRRDPIDVLEAQGDSRAPELVPIRYGRMVASPFAFFRGGAAIMAMDLATTPVTGLRVQACGDAHVANFGKFATPERNLMFDINDFDETLPGPWEWDVKRLCASLHVVARGHGYSPAKCDEVVVTAARAYRERLTGSSSMRTLDLWYDRIHVKQVIDHFPPEYRPSVKRDVRKAQRKGHARAVNKLTQTVDGRLQFAEDPPLLVHLEDTGADFAEDVVPMIASYRETLTEDRQELFDRFEVVDVARKVVGVGSVGTRCWVALLEGPDHLEGDRLILQVKEAQPSVLEPYVGASALGHNGLRVVAGQRLTQAASDMFLGWSEGPRSGREYYVRQLWDVKGQGDLEKMDFNNLTYYGALCAWALARAHARTGDAVQLSAYLGKGDTFDRAIASFSAAYALTNEADHAALVDAIASGRIDAQHGI